jgi:hypothetical protein
VAAGAYRDDDNGYDAGAVYIFRFDGADGSQEAKLTPSDASDGEIWSACCRQQRRRNPGDWGASQ